MRRLVYLIGFCVFALALCATPGISGASGKAYVLEQTEPMAGSVVVLDAGTHAVLGRIPLVGIPSEDDEMALSPSGDRAYVVNVNRSAITVIDIRLDSVADTIPLAKGFRPYGVAVSPSGEVAYVSVVRTSSRSSYEVAYLFVVDLAQRKVMRSIGLGTANFARVKMHPDGETVYVLRHNGFTSNLSAIDTATLRVSAQVNWLGTIRDFAFSPSGDAAYAVSSGSGWFSSTGTIEEIDTATHRVVGSVAVGNDPGGVAVSPSGDFIYVTSGDDSLTVVGAIPFRVVKKITRVSPDPDTGLRKVAFSPSGDLAYITADSNPGLFVMDTSRHRVMGQASLGPAGAVAFLEGNQAPTAHAGDDQVANCSGPDGATVSLDGSGSNDPDGDELTYTWAGSFGTATGVTPSISFPVGKHAVTLTVDDGNETDTDEVIVEVKDLSPPSTSVLISGEKGNAGWYVSLVDISLSATDNCSGVAELRYTVNGTSSTVNDSAVAIVLYDGVNTVSFEAMDGAGNVEKAREVTYMVDHTAPEIKVTGVEMGTAYALGLDPAPGYEATDETSGVASSSASLTGGDGLGLGTFAYEVTAEDRAGNTKSVTVTYKVVATVEGTISLVGKMVSPPMSKPLLAKLGNALKAGNANAADGILGAFINQVRAQTGKKIDPGAAAVLINAARYMIDNN